MSRMSMRMCKTSTSWTDRNNATLTSTEQLLVGVIIGRGHCVSLSMVVDDVIMTPVSSLKFKKFRNWLGLGSSRKRTSSREEMKEEEMDGEEARSWRRSPMNTRGTDSSFTDQRMS